MLRRKISWFIAGLLLAVSLGVVAQQGGFPSRPRFQQVTVAAAPAATYGQVGLRGNAAGVGNVAYLSFSDSAGTRTGYIGDDSAADQRLSIENSVSGANLLLTTTGTGQVQVNGRDTGYSSGIYTGTVVGCTTNPAPVIVWHKFGGMVSLQFQPFTCTSNSGLLTISGGPAAIRPTANSNVQLQHCINNGVNAPGSCEMYMGSNGTLNTAYLGSTWTNVGTKGLGFSGGSVTLFYSAQW